MNNAAQKQHLVHMKAWAEWTGAQRKTIINLNHGWLACTFRFAWSHFAVSHLADHTRDLGNPLQVRNISIDVLSVLPNPHDMPRSKTSSESEFQPRRSHFKFLHVAQQKQSLPLKERVPGHQCFYFRRDSGNRGISPRIEWKQGCLTTSSLFSVLRRRLWTVSWSCWACFEISPTAFWPCEAFWQMTWGDNEGRRLLDVFLEV